jgi:hypothetical protein
MEPNVYFVAEEFPKRIEKLSEGHERQWGKMSPQHMVEHLGSIFLIGSGKIRVPGLPEEKQKRMYAALTNGQFRFTPGTKSPVLPEDLLPLRFNDLETAKKAMLKGVHQFFEAFEAKPDQKIDHPVFGPLSYLEWLEFHEMHLKHHLEQFNLMEVGSE